MKLKNTFSFSMRWLGMLAVALMWAAPSHGQLAAQDEGITAQPGSWFSYDGLALLPAEGAPLVMRGNTLALRTSPAAIGKGNSLPRVYRLSGPVAFTGRVRVRYQTAELGRHDAAALLIFAQTAEDAPFKPVMASTAHTGGDSYVEADLEDRAFAALTIADPLALGYALTPQAPTASETTDRAFALAWPEVIGAESYQLDVSTAADFSSPVPGYSGLAVAGASAPVSGLQPGTRYYFRVRSVDAENRTQQSPPGDERTLTFVASIARNSATPTNAATLSYTVTFASAVSGVDAGDFELSTTGSAAAAIGTPAGSGAVWTVPLTGITGQGTLRLDFIDTAGVQPHAVRTFASGEAYATDRVPPVAKTRNIELLLGPDGTVTVTPQQVDGGSADEGGPVTLSLDKTVFTRNETGDRTVTLTVTDAVGNASTATATVNVGRDVATVADPADVAAAYGIPAAQLPLPDRVEVTYTDGTTADVAVTWDRSAFGDGVGTYTLSGDIVPAEHTTNTQAAKATVRVAVAKAAQTITFSAPHVVDRDAGSMPLQATSSAGLPVALSVDDEQVAVLAGNTLHILRLGTVRVTATQAGDENHEAAAPVTVAVTVQDPAADLPVRVHPVVTVTGDGRNEFLLIEGIRDYPENKVTIFNKNGTLVYEVTGYDNGASRAFRGLGTGQIPVPGGTYFYIVEVRVDGQWKYRTGYFILR